MGRTIRQGLAAGLVTGCLLLRLLQPGLFAAVRGLLVDPRGEAASRAVFRAWEDSGELRGGAIPVWGGAADD